MTNKGHFKNTPGYSGSITLRFSDKNVITLALMQELIPNEGDAWEYFLKNLKKAFFKANELNVDVNQLKKLHPFDQISSDKVDENVLEFCDRSFLKM